MKGHDTKDRCPNPVERGQIWCLQHLKGMTPGQKLDETIAIEQRRAARVSKLLEGLDQDDLKTLYGIIHTKLYGEDD